MAANLKDAFYQSAEIISHLLNESDPECWSEFTQEQLSDCINVCFSVAGLLEIAEMERIRKAEGQNNES